MEKGEWGAILLFSWACPPQGGEAAQRTFLASRRFRQIPARPNRAIPRKKSDAGSYTGAASALAALGVVRLPLTGCTAWPLEREVSCPLKDVVTATGEWVVSAEAISRGWVVYPASGATMDSWIVCGEAKTVSLAKKMAKNVNSQGVKRYFIMSPNVGRVNDETIWRSMMEMFWNRCPWALCDPVMVRVRGRFQLKG